jgi:hypothetical protein
MSTPGSLAEMSLLLAVLLAFVSLASPFTEASATAVSVDDGLRVEVSVGVEGSPLAVVVRGVGPGLSELPPVALANHGDGIWEGIVDLPVVENIQLGFEWIPESGGPTAVSELHSLTELGVDRAVFQRSPARTTVTTDAALELQPATRRWGWLGLGTGAAALALIALWAIARRRDAPADDSTERPADDLAGEPEDDAEPPDIEATGDEAAPAPGAG